MANHNFIVMRRDASWYRNPGHATAYHVPAKGDGALCNSRLILNEETAVPANQVGAHMLCYRCVVIKESRAAHPAT